MFTFGQRFAGEPAAAFQLIPAPLEEVADHRPGVILPVLVFLLAIQSVRFDGLLVQLGDLLQGLGGLLRMTFLGVDKASATVDPNTKRG